VVPPAATRYRLIGIVGHTALLQAGNAAVQPVRVGAEIGDYQVTAVDDDYAILAAEGQPDTLRVSADVRVK
jgi:hypothetical protein